MAVNRFLACLALVVLPLVEFAPSAGAYGGGACRITGRIAFSPGSATSGQWTIDNGVIDCQGLLSGGKNRIVGPGEFKGSGSYTSSLPTGGPCLQQTGSGTLEYRIPTSGGFLFISEPDSYTLVGAGEFVTPTLHGTFELAPPYAGGDCVTKPPTRAAFAAQAVLFRGVEPGV
jgi:hypothetical protein